MNASTIDASHSRCLVLADPPPYVCAAVGLTRRARAVRVHGEQMIATDKCEIVVLKVRRDADGLFTATSPDLVGVCVVHRDLDRIVDDLPNIVRHWYRRHRGIAVEPFFGPRKAHDDTTSFSVFAVPAEIAEQALAR